MTRKDFELIAHVVLYARVNAADRQLVAEDFARVLATTNPRFDSARFIRAATEGK